MKTVAYSFGITGGALLAIGDIIHNSLCASIGAWLLFLAFLVLLLDSRFGSHTGGST